MHWLQELESTISKFSLRFLFWCNKGHYTLTTLFVFFPEKVSRSQVLLSLTGNNLSLRFRLSAKTLGSAFSIVHVQIHIEGATETKGSVLPKNMSICVLWPQESNLLLLLLDITHNIFLYHSTVIKMIHILKRCKIKSRSNQRPTII